MNNGVRYGIPQTAITPQTAMNNGVKYPQADINTQTVATQERLKIQLLKDLKHSLHEDNDLSLRVLIRDLATIFSPSTTLGEISGYLTEADLPVKIINGKEYKAGYAGRSIFLDGDHFSIKLIDMQDTKDGIKLLFANSNNRYIWSRPVKLEQSKLISIAKNLRIENKSYRISVVHEKIEKTGDLHATVVSWKES